MKPFFTYYGGKWRAAPRYPQPLYKTIIEPFAGSAGYATRHYTKDVILIEKDETIANLWAWLIAAEPRDVLRLPLMGDNDNVDSVDAPTEAKHLIGFWLNKGAAQPCKTPSQWMRSGIRPNSYWGEAIRERIAYQVPYIKHWKVLHGNYDALTSVEATWFVDPPYALAGKHYRHSSANINYSTLGWWCRKQRGQIIVCENEGANWLPFQPFEVSKSSPSSRGKGYSKESIWTSLNH